MVAPGKASAFSSIKTERVRLDYFGEVATGGCGLEFPQKQGTGADLHVPYAAGKLEVTHITASSV